MNNRGHLLMNNMRSAIRQYKDKYFTSNDLLNLLNNNMAGIERNMQKAPKINSVKNKPQTISEIVRNFTDIECIEAYNILSENFPVEDDECQDVREFAPDEIQEVKKELGLQSDTTNDESLIEELKRMSTKSKATLKAVKLTKKKINQLLDFLSVSPSKAPDLGGTLYKD